MKMFRPKTLQEASYPLEIISRILGVGIFEHSSNRLRNALGFLYNGICFGAYCVLVSASSAYANSVHMGDNSQLGKISFQIVFYGNACLGLWSIVYGWYRTKKTRESILCMEKCDQALLRMGANANYSKIFKMCIILLAIMILVISCFGIITWCWMIIEALFQFKKVSQLWLVLVSMAYPAVVMNLADTAFLYWIKYFQMRYAQVNDLLRAMVKTTPEWPQHKRVLKMRDDFREEDFDKRKEKLGTLIAAKLVHLDLTKSARKMNRAYGMQLLVSMTMSFVVVTELLYDTYGIVWMGVHGIQRTLEIACLVCWFVMYAFKIFIVSHVCAHASHEATKTGSIVCELYEPFAEEEFRAEIRDFTLQLIQNPLYFTGCGFFQLDHTFVQGVIGSVTTYLVILIQVSKSIPSTSNAENATMSANTTIFGDDSFTTFNYTDYGAI